MRRPLIALAALASLAAFAAIVVATAPASLAGAALSRASGGTLILANAEGTVWRGRATLAGPRAMRLPLAWSIALLPLLRGELRVRVLPPTAAAVTPRAEISVQRDAVAVRDADVTIPVEAALGFAPRLSLLAAGTVRITTASLEWTPAAFAGGLAADWRDARIGLPDNADTSLGTVTAALTAAGERLTGPVTNDGGAFGVRGTFSVSSSGAPDVSIALTPRGGDPAQARTLTVTGGSAGAGLNLDLRSGPR